MKTIRYILTVILTCALASCTEVEIDYLYVDTSEVKQIPAEGGSTTINVEASYCPRVKCTDDWLSYKINQIEDEKYKVVVSAQATKQTIERLSTVTFTLGELSRKVEVSQAAKKQEIDNNTDTDNKEDDKPVNVDPSKTRTLNHAAALAIAQHGGYVVREYQDKGSYVLLFFEQTTENPVVPGFEEYYPNGFTTLKVSYEKDGLSSVILKENDQLELSFNDNSKAIFMYEEPYLSMISQPEILISDSDTTLTLEYDTNIEFTQLNARSNQSWVSISHEKSALTITIQTNDSETERTAHVQLTSTTTNHNLVWNITQKGAVIETPEGMVLFEDMAFKRAVLKDYDFDADGQISIEEAESIERLDVSGLGIKSLKGIEPMKNLKYLNIADNRLSAPSPDRLSEAVLVDLSHPHPYLIDIVCDRYFSIDVTGCAAVVWIKTRGDEGKYDTIDSDEINIIAGRCQNVVDYNYEKYAWMLNGSTSINDGQHIPRQSTDFSKRNQKVYLNTHTKGSGIKIQFTIDGLIDTDVQSELDERIAQTVCNALFELEPLKSYREYFDIIYKVSVREYRSNEYYDDDIKSLEDQVMVKENGPDMVFCTEYSMQNNRTSRWMSAQNIINHEITGHNFAYLQDSHDWYASTNRLQYFTNVWFPKTGDLPWYWKELMNNPDYKEYVQLLKIVEGEQYASHMFDLMAAGKKFSALERFIILAHIIYRSGLYTEIFPENIFEHKTRITLQEYEQLCEIPANQKALMDYFLQYDKINI